MNVTLSPCGRAILADPSIGRLIAREFRQSHASRRCVDAGAITSRTPKREHIRTDSARNPLGERIVFRRQQAAIQDPGTITDPFQMKMVKNPGVY